MSDVEARVKDVIAFSKDGSLENNLNIAGWQSLMGLACIFGWEPQGTVLTSWKPTQRDRKR